MMKKDRQRPFRSDSKPPRQPTNSRLPGDLQALCFASDVSTGENFLIVRFTDKLGHRTKHRIPLRNLGEASARAVMLELAAAKFPTPSNKADRERIFTHLQAAAPEQEVRFVSRTGWYGREGYLLGRRWIGCLGAIYRPSDAIAEELGKFGKRGNLAEWQNRIGRHCLGNSRLMFCVAAAFAGPLVDVVGAESMGFYFCGPERSGKSTCQRVGFSVIGGDGQRDGGLESFDSSIPSIEPLSAVNCDSLLCLDELSQIQTHALSQLIHKLANQNKARRADSHGKLRRRPEATRVTFVGSGNDTVGGYGLHSHGATARAAAVRMIEFPACPKGGAGVFERIPHRFRREDHPSRAFSLYLNKAITQQYGTPIRGYLRSLVERRATDEHALQREIQRIRNEFIARVVLPTDNPGLLDVAGRFGLVLAGGLLAVRFGVLDWPSKRMKWAIRTCFEAHREHLESVAAATSTRVPLPSVSTGEEIIAAVRGYVARERGRIPEFSEQNPLSTAAVAAAIGFRRVDGKSGPKVILKAQPLEAAICQGGSSKKQLMAALLAAGLIKQDKDGRKKTKTTVSGTTVNQCYQLSMKLWPGDLED